ncbi:starch synthase [Tistlia consotensis]|uniref:Glycogen synthase n=1 Tax=Tistlia consotensis USBA 355 TaxID=560819 RepID=A0A1Y6BUT2_9PROT|nr:glycogen synthase GlgA [Tistlia consotensis]SMF29681.1 starch synthase [Tistlia consotensis USBA 355]SNR91011.1 starch synthase [Tistlia consotensis]
MQVLFVASECAPFVKTGGLADVVAALPKALAAEGVSVKVLLPAYPALAGQVAAGEEVAQPKRLPGGRTRLVAVRDQGLDLLLLDAPALYERPGNPYVDATGRDWPDNHLRFGALGAAGAWVARHGLDGWRPEVLHAHDWQAGLAPALLRLGRPAAKRKATAGTVTTIHNIAFQGLFPATTIPELGLPPSEFRIEGFEYHGRLSFLKAGLVWADRITTVSPGYARELMTPEFGLGFEGILASRRDDFSGILNGIELDAWDPAGDPALVATYSERSLARRLRNRAALERRFGLEPAEDAPLFCVVSRLTRQKGLDLLLEALPRLLGRGGRLALLGSGDADLEAGWRAAAAAHPGRVGVEIGYDEPLSHLLQGGADCILIPSRFEPCGLTQLYGLRYGCLPLVARTGGLADTVIDANEAAIAADVATGFQFAPVTAEALAGAIDRACSLYADRPAWQAMMRRAMRHPVGWQRSAAAYRALYERVAPDRPGRPA